MLLLLGESESHQSNLRARSQNHRMVGAGRNLCGSSSPTPLLKQGHLHHLTGWCPGEVRSCHNIQTTCSVLQGLKPQAQVPSAVTSPGGPSSSRTKHITKNLPMSAQKVLPPGCWADGEWHIGRNMQVVSLSIPLTQPDSTLAWQTATLSSAESRKSREGLNFAGIRVVRFGPFPMCKHVKSCKPSEAFSHASANFLIKACLRAQLLPQLANLHLRMLFLNSCNACPFLHREVLTKSCFFLFFFFL